ncbi:MAG: DUF3887 domain-containing protein [Bacteroidia bacterium]|nr:DUF3887 domain-containing protein [Bacteroidia bacterium]
MKYLFLIILNTFLNQSICKAQVLFDAKVKSIEIIDLLKKQKFNDVYSAMDSVMNRLLNAEQLEGIWDGLLMQFDTLYEISEPVINIVSDTLTATVTTLRFKNMKLGLKLAFNQTGKISGLYVVPVAYPYQPAWYVNTAGFYEIKKNIPDPEYPSEGILTLPNGSKKVAVVIIVGGSGPVDKDLTEGPNKVYKDIAWGLASKGVATYRFDKRTVNFASQMIAEEKLTVKEEYLDDVKLIVAMLSKYSRIDKHQIFILGHSEGGYLLPYFAKHVNGVRGYISMAGNYNKLAVLVPNQIKYLALHSDTEKEKKEILKNLPPAVYARDHLTKNTPDDSLPFGLNTAYLWHLNQNGPEVLRNKLMNKPVLFIQGGRDYQVPPSELDKWKMALAKNNRVTYKIYPALNHLFQEGKAPSIPAEYIRPGNVPEEVINDIASWVLHTHASGNYK